MNISVVIPNFNGKNLLSQNLPSIFDVLEKYKDGRTEIVIADDASKDDSLEFLNSFFREYSGKVTTKILTNTTGKNKGFAGNVNKGVANTTGDIIILLNSDVLPDKDFLTPLLIHFTDEKIFAVGCLDESVENGKTILRGRGLGKWEKGFLVHRRGEINDTNTLWVSCGSGAFRKSMWDMLGGLEEVYNPFYWEDIDISYRAQKAGLKVAFEPKSKVVHRHEEGAIKKNYSRFSVTKVVYRNQFFFTWLNATDKMILISHIFYLPYFFLRAIRNKDRAFFTGFLMALRSLPKVIQERKKVQSLVKRSDKEVIRVHS